MKSVLRNTHHVVNAHHHSSKRRAVLTPLDPSGKTLTGIVFAALATITGCSSAEAFEPETVSGPTPTTVDSSQPSDIQRGTPQSGIGSTDTAVEGAAVRSEAAPASPGGGNEGAPVPSTVAPAIAAEGDEAEGEGTERDVVAPVERATMMTSGRQLLDTCGKPFVTRGVEQIFGEQLPQGNDWAGLLEEIAKSGVNAVRLLVSTDTLDLDNIDRLLDVVAEHGMVAYVTPYGNEATRWLEGQEVRAMLAQHEKYILIDAFGEPTFDDRERFIRDSVETIREVRSWGYRVPLTVTANQFGRDLPSLFEFGAEIVAADPLHNTVLGWQAYWSQNNYYQEHYGYSLTEAVDAISQAPFPIQLGLDRITDFPSSDTADFGTLMAATETHGIGWLWWDWYNPYGNENNLSEDGSAAQLTATGSSVIETHSASVQNTAERVCIR
jgi:hypothetical protein